MSVTISRCKGLCCRVSRPSLQDFYQAWKRDWRSMTGTQHIQCLLIKNPSTILQQQKVYLIQLRRFSKEICPLTLSRTDALLVKLSLLVGQQVLYGALWGSILISPMVRLPASVFIVTHFDRMASQQQQKYMLGYDRDLVVSVFFLSTYIFQFSFYSFIS